jgi:hypothetical protein
MVFELFVHTVIILSYIFNMIPVLPSSIPDIILTRWPSLNFFDKFYKGYDKIASFISLFLHFIIPILSLISINIP